MGSIGEEHMNIFERMINVVKTENWKTIVKSLLLIIILIIIMCSGLWAALGTIVTNALDKQQREKLEFHESALQMRKEIKPTVDSLLNRALTILDADRVAIIEMHNGTSNTAGLPFLYGEMTYSVNSDSIYSVDNDYVNLNLSRFNFSYFFEKQHIWQGTTEEMAKIDSKLAQRIASNDVTYIAMSHIHGINNELGYFVITYCNGKTPKPKDFIVVEMMKKTQMLSTLLDINSVPK